MSVSSNRPASPVRLGGRYRLDERIGAGGMGEVWRATDEVLGRTVAVKLILPSLLADPGFARRFLVEAQSMAGVSHPGVVAIHDYYTDGNGAFLVMQYVHGESLSQALGRIGRLSPDATIHLIAQAATAIHAVHAQGIVHRDIKPANLMLRPDGTVMVTDFGIARTAGSTSLTQSGAVLGTPSYLAPEQVMGHPATVLSDIYALGLVAYECLAGHRPFEGDNPYAIALQRLHQAPRTLVSTAGSDVLQVIERALATDPAQRWSTADEMAAAARATIHPTSGRQPSAPAPVIPRQPSTTPSAPQWHAPDPRPAWQPVALPARAPDRRRLTYIAIAAATVLLVGVAAAWFASATDARTATPVGAAHTTATGSSPTTGHSPAAGSSSRSSTTSAVPAGFRLCGTGYCPTVAACWHGLVDISGVTAMPASADCAQPHYWQTFVAANLPSAAVHVAQDGLMQRSDVAGICSASALARNSRDPEHTHGWRRDALPVQQDDGRWLVYCIANSPDGETTGSII